MPKGKKFIDKKKAVTFQLVHRSQQDPLVADENAPQRVLLPVQGKEATSDKERRLEEQHKYGIYYDDDCNYLEHLKDPKDNTLSWPDNVNDSLKERQEKLKQQLPPSVFPSEVEDEVGMLAKAAPVSGPQLHLDPDIVAAMDEDFDYSDPENELEDNFIELAQGVASDQEFDEDDDDYNLGSDFEDDEEMDEVGSLPGSERTYDEEETKSRFTSYSMTSSVMRRNEQLSLLDNRFEKMYADYDENEIGALDCEEIEGHVPGSSHLLQQYAEEFKKMQQREKLDENKKEVVSRIKKLLENDDEEEEGQYESIVVPQKIKYDCQSILSTYSNIYNRPKIIDEPKKDNKIKINKRTGIPENVLDSNKLTTKALNKLNEEYDSQTNNKGPKSYGGQSIISQLSVLSIRDPNETPEEKKERKKALKEYRKERRIERKANKEAFKEEQKRQVKIAINNRNNVQGNKIL
ncbi:protein LTV1 homolog [Aethina tumida]|uniref:protein LTV1 homolog n=1 Tax=Aethina tumida TaxID=116153 RepID=UPI002148304A|nr:protein LTV1 homolog [Aethina tumida]